MLEEALALYSFEKKLGRPCLAGLVFSNQKKGRATSRWRREGVATPHVYSKKEGGGAIAQLKGGGGVNI